MTEPRISATSATAYIFASAETLAEAEADRAAWERWQNATPEQRAEWQREAIERRALERAAATVKPLTLAALIGRMGWSEDYAEHLVQTYCGCGAGSDGWDYCQHAIDLGLAR